MGEQGLQLFQVEGPVDFAAWPLGPRSLSLQNKEQHFKTFISETLFIVRCRLYPVMFWWWCWVVLVRFRPVVLNRRPPGRIRPPVCGPRTVIPSLMYFGWVSTRIPKLASMPTIHRQLSHSLLWAQFLTFTFVFGAVRILTFCQL